MTQTRAAPAIRRLAIAIAGILVASLSIACSKPTSPSSQTAPYVGSWAGSMVDPRFGTGLLRLAIPAAAEGYYPKAWSVTFSSQTNNDGGTLQLVTGERTGLSLLSTVKRCPGPIGGGPWKIVLFTVNGNHLSGSYTDLACDGIFEGTIELDRQ